MAKKQSYKKTSQGAEKGEVEGNVDKIRDILFGTQMREYEQRLDAMEQRVVQNIERAARDLERRIERLDTFAHRELDKLTDQIRTERKDRAAEGKKGANDFNRLADQVETWFAEVDEQLATDSKDLRDSMHEQSEELAAQIRESTEQLQEALHKEVSELSNVKLAREDLAALFTEVAMRLNKDFKLPKD